MISLMNNKLIEQIEEAKRELKASLNESPVSQPIATVEQPSPISLDKQPDIIPQKQLSKWHTAGSVFFFGLFSGALFALTPLAALYVAALASFGSLAFVFILKYVFIVLLVVVALLLGLLMQKLRLRHAVFAIPFAYISAFPLSSYRHESLISYILVALVTTLYFFVFYLLFSLLKSKRLIAFVLAILLCIGNYFGTDRLPSAVIKGLDITANQSQTKSETKQALNVFAFKLYALADSDARFKLQDVVPHADSFDKIKYLELVYKDTTAGSEPIYIKEFAQPAYYMPPSNCGQDSPTDMATSTGFACKSLKTTSKGRQIYAYSQYYNPSFGYTSEQLKTIQPEWFFVEISGTVISMKGFVQDSVTAQDIVSLVDSFEENTPEKISSKSYGSIQPTEAIYQSHISFDTYIPTYIATDYAEQYLIAENPKDPTNPYLQFSFGPTNDKYHQKGAYSISEFPVSERFQPPEDCGPRNTEDNYTFKRVCYLYATTKQGYKLYASGQKGRAIPTDFYVKIGSTMVVLESIQEQADAIKIIDSMVKTPKDKIKYKSQKTDAGQLGRE